MKKIGKNLFVTAMLILASIFVTQSAMAETFQQTEYFLYGDWERPYWTTTTIQTFNIDHTMGGSNNGGTWSYDGSTGIVTITWTNHHVTKLKAESRIKLSNISDSGEDNYIWTKIQADCGQEDYNQDGSLDVNDFLDNEYDVRRDFEIKRQALDKELEEELLKIRQKLQSCWIQNCD